MTDRLTLARALEEGGASHDAAEAARLAALVPVKV
jgi:hypothetical protein